MKPEFNVYVISDTHFNHFNIINLCHRPYKSGEEMNDKMINSWNAIVRPQDVIIHLGDLIFTKGASEEIKKIIKRLNGRKILVAGNHDRKSYSFYMSAGIEFICESFRWFYNDKQIMFIHSPHDIDPSILKKVDYIIHGHSHQNSPFISKVKKTTFINVSVEQIQYKPILLITLFNRVKQGYYDKKGKK